MHSHSPLVWSAQRCQRQSVPARPGMLRPLVPGSWGALGSFSVFLHSSPNPAGLGRPGCEAHPFKSAWESPGPPSPARARTSKRPLRDPVAEGAGGPWGGGFAGLPFIPAGSRPPGRSLWASASPYTPGEEDLGLQSSTELCDLPHATACLWASASPAACLPDQQSQARAREGSFKRLALLFFCTDHSSCPHTADPRAVCRYNITSYPFSVEPLQVQRGQVTCPQVTQPVGKIDDQ